MPGASVVCITGALLGVVFNHKKRAAPVLAGLAP